MLYIKTIEGINNQYNKKITVTQKKQNMMNLIELIKKNLREKDKKILLFLDLDKTDEDIITDMVAAGFLNFGSSDSDDKENK